MKPKEIRAAGQVLRRTWLAQRVLQIASDIVKADNYKQAIEGAGRMATIVTACGYDNYWAEKTLDGKYREETTLLRAARAALEADAPRISDDGS